MLGGKTKEGGRKGARKMSSFVENHQSVGFGKKQQAANCDGQDSKNNKPPQKKETPHTKKKKKPYTKKKKKKKRKEQKKKQNASQHTKT